ncbi:sensor histidine kinase [Crenalkalicoccus roseus]|uniref:sensor histidine kinase n=1 Tax=Crenalkalicoccus roseus TaxID=1485588 RepID=UPI00108229E6|nr:HWE histidine kinase domain-containing protein [Crenalkalicoccus roseus]
MQPRRTPPGPAPSARTLLITGLVLFLSAAVAGLGTLLLLAPLVPGGTDRPAQAEALAAEARGLALAADAEVERRLSLLAALAASPALDQPAGDLRALDQQARAVASVLNAPVAVADTSLAQLANTAVAFGTPLPGLDDAPVALQTLDSGRATAGEAVAGGVSLAVPVRREDRVVAVIASRLPPEALVRLLGGAAAEGGSAAILGAGGRVVAREGAAGPPAGREAWAAAPLLHATSPLQTLPGWQVAITRPPPPAPAPAGALPVLLVSAGMAALAALAAWLALRRRPWRRLEQALLAAEAARRAAETSEAAALHGLAEARRLHDTIPVGLALTDRELRFISVNAKFASVTGIRAQEHLRRRPAEVLPAAIAEALEEALREVIGTGQPVIELPLSAEAPGALRNERHFLASCHPALDGEQRITGISIVLQDVTERVRAERARELLMRELNHRVKNMLATVQAIALVTLRQSAADPARLSAELEARLLALARAHDLLTAHAWEPTDLAAVVRAALAPWLETMPARLGIEGPRGVLLRPSQAQAVVLALHELATNAVKYGALSNQEGRVELRWRCGPDGRTEMEWRESGGPPVRPPRPDRRGFGMRLLERGLASDLGTGAEVRLAFAPEGLRAWVRFPSGGAARGRAPPGGAEPGAPPPPRGPALLAYAAPAPDTPARGEPS